MLATILQTLFKLSAIFGLIFMIACTVFVIVCIIHGDIKINITRDGTEKEKKQKKEKYTVVSLLWTDH